MQLCLTPRLQSLKLSFIHLKQRELSPLISIPTVTLFCVNATSEPPSSSAGTSSSSLSSPSSIQLQDLTLTANYADGRLSSVWSIVKTAGSSLTSLRIYSSPYGGMSFKRKHELNTTDHIIDCQLSSLDDIDLRKLPSLLSLAISIPLTSNACIEKITSIFSPLFEASSSSKIKCIEICCDIDLYSFPSQRILDTWNWASLDAVLSSTTYEKLERLEITVKKAIRSRNTWHRQRRYKDLEGMLVDLFRGRLPVVSKAVIVISGPSVEEV